MQDTPQEAMIGDKAAKELLASEKLMQSLENNDLFKRAQLTLEVEKLKAVNAHLLSACKIMIEWSDAEKSAKPFVDDGGAAFYARVALCESAFAKARAAIKEAEAL